MKRRELMLLLGSAKARRTDPPIGQPVTMLRVALLAVIALLAVPPVSEAQQSKTIPRLCFLGFEPYTLGTRPGIDAFFETLRDLGYVDGRSIIIDYLSADGRGERFPALADECLRRKADVIVPSTTPAALAAKNATRTIPIVMLVMGDPLGTGLVDSLARPGGNVTGTSLMVTDLAAKRLELLKEAVPQTTRTAFLGMREGWEGSFGQAMRDVASRLGISLISMLPNGGTTAEIERVFAEMAGQRPDAVLITGEGDLYANHQLIAALAQKYQMPTMCPYRDYVDAGGLMAYTVDLAELNRRMARDVQQILNGTKPSEIPIYQPTKFELLINQKTAKLLGLTLPPTLLSRADEMLE
jgi:putative tryptophan/tyrosine transport system substrate-binding protein